MRSNAKGKTRIYFLLAVAVALSFSMLFSSSGGIAGSGETTTWNATNDSCSIASGSISCFKTITWATPLASAPCGGCSMATSTTANLLIPQITVTTKIFFAMGSLGQTWVSMPVAQTSIFGDALCQHCIIVDLGSYNARTVLGNFIVTCNTPSNSANAVLRLQIARVGNPPFVDITGSDVDISATSPCGSQPQDSCNTSNPGFTGCYPFTIATEVAGEGDWIQITGINGGGFGDNPNFVSAELMLQSSVTVVSTIIARLGTASATQITVLMDITYPRSTAITATFRVEAWICKNGGSTC